MPATDTPTIQQAKETIRKLKDDLSSARFAITLVMPDDITKLLHSYFGCTSHEQANQWREDVIEILVEGADASALDDRDRGGRRALCPLCHSGSTGSPGYALPEGLRRHLDGRTQTLHCVVMEAVSGLLWEYVEEHLAPTGQAKLNALAKRHKTETLYRVAPDKEPELLNELSPFDLARSPDQLVWADQRLESLGCQVVT